MTTTGIVERHTSEIKVNDYAVIEFWDKNTAAGNRVIEFEDFYDTNYDSNSRYLTIQVYVNNSNCVTETFLLDMTDSAYDTVNLQTTVRPENGYYLARECEWQKAGSDEVNSKFGGSGSTGMNQAGGNPKVNTLKIYLTTQNPNNSCSGEINDTTKNISVDLYNYDTEAYNNTVGLNSSSLLLRSAWGNYKADGYNVDGYNAHNESCGSDGIYYGLAQPSLNNGNIVFNKTAKFLIISLILVLEQNILMLILNLFMMKPLGSTNTTAKRIMYTLTRQPILFRNIAEQGLIHSRIAVI